LNDLLRESELVDAWVSRLRDEWAVVTTREGWTVADQIGHLAAIDEAALMAATDPDSFARLKSSAIADPDRHNTDTYARTRADLGPPALLELWRTGRQRLWEALRKADPADRLPWFGPSMSVSSMSTARLMETWAHGTDIATSLAIDVPRSDRVRHVCDLGVRTRDFSFRSRGLRPPEEEFFVSLVAPSGVTWTWGPSAATSRVDGSAWDFALLVTRRRHRSRLDVSAQGASADLWLDIAQAFAGPAGRDPEPTASGR
jgi:uncharacterized protein (TIGR03084 family)